MQVSASEGLANHTVPESCAETREGFGEALTGVRIGWVLSRENNTLGVEGNMARRASASAWTARRGRRPQHVRKLLAREPGDLASGQDQYTGPHRESDELKPMMYGDEKSDLS